MGVVRKINLAQFKLKNTIKGSIKQKNLMFAYLWRNFKSVATIYCDKALLFFPKYRSAIDIFNLLVKFHLIKLRQTYGSLLGPKKQKSFVISR